MQIIAIKITDFLHSKNYIREIEKEAYVYSIEICLASFINILLISIIAIILKSLTILPIYLLTFASLRQYSGGFHFNSHYLCIIVYCTICAMTFILLNKYLINNIISFIFLIIGVIYLYRVAPIEHINNPLSEHKFILIRKKLIRRLLIVVTISIFLIFFPKQVMAMMLAVTQVSFLVIIEKIIRHKKKGEVYV